MLEKGKSKKMHEDQIREKTLWLFRYSSDSHQASHVKLFYASDVEDAKIQIKGFTDAINHEVNEERLEPMPSGFSIASRFFPGKVQVSSDGT